MELNSALLSIYAFALAGFSKFILATASQWPQRGYFARITWSTIEYNDSESMIKSNWTSCRAIVSVFKSTESIEPALAVSTCSTQNVSLQTLYNG